MRNCEVCVKEFEPIQQNMRFCSLVCRKKNEAINWGQFCDLELSKGTVGAISEMVVAVDLMEKGYAVFRALSPACHCDLIATRGSETLRVEVRTGYINKNGKVNFPLSEKDRGRQDIFGVFSRINRAITYFTPDRVEITL